MFLQICYKIMVFLINYNLLQTETQLNLETKLKTVFQSLQKQNPSLQNDDIYSETSSTNEDDDDESPLLMNNLETTQTDNIKQHYLTILGFTQKEFETYQNNILFFEKIFKNRK